MTNQVNVRELVLEVLLAVNRDGEYSHIALKEMLDKYQYLTKQERSYITRVCQGTVERMLWIDYVINSFSKVKVNKMKPVICNILRAAVYELQFMDAIPVSASCNEAVKLAQKKGFHNLKGFVNGVLRSIERNLQQIELPDRKEDEIKYLSIAYSMPEWIVKQWGQVYGFKQTESMLKAQLLESSMCIRINSTRITKEKLIERLEKEGVTVEESSELPYALMIKGFDYLHSLSSFREGLFYVQDISSMLVSHLAEPKEGDFVIDVCAAPGGKSMHMAELLQGTGMVDSRDLTAYKVGLIQENINRCQLKNIKATQADARILREEDIEKADIVLADLPCSGLGVIGKKPDIKYKMTVDKQKELSKLQREILNTVCRYVKPKGTLMYSTCTIDYGENEENTAWFIKEHPEFRLVFEKQILPGLERQDGFFIAKFVKENYGEN